MNAPTTFTDEQLLAAGKITIDLFLQRLEFYLMIARIEKRSIDALGVEDVIRDIRSFASGLIDADFMIDSNRLTQDGIFARVIGEDI